MSPMVRAMNSTFSRLFPIMLITQSTDKIFSQSDETPSLTMVCHRTTAVILSRVDSSPNVHVDTYFLQTEQAECRGA